MSAEDGSRECDVPSDLRALLQGRRWLARVFQLLTPFGVLGVYAGLRLGHGRLHAVEYQCVLLSSLFGVLALLGITVQLQLSSVFPRLSRWGARASGGLVSLGLFIVLYLAAQGICWTINAHEAARSTRTGTHSDGTSYQSSFILGHMPRRNVRSGARLVADGTEVFDYTYQIDNFRRRVVPDFDSSMSHPRAVVFFGDSFTFGEGVNDAETLPNQLALARPDLAVYNYAFSGYGPNHMLARLEALDTRAEIPERKAIGVYVFIPNHVRRVIGAFSVISWSRHSPWYTLDNNGQPLRLGSFQGERPRLTGWYDFLKGDEVLKYLQIDFPIRLRPKDFLLTEAVIAQSARRFKEQFQGGTFYVVLYPASPADEFPAAVMGTRLQARGLQVLDYSGLLSGTPENSFYLPFDTHPRPEAHARVAGQLALDLPAADAEQIP